MTADKDSLIGKTLGGYEIIEALASGGMGTVYKARHTRLEKVVALKVLAQKMQLVDEYVERFHREALLAAKLEHPNIVRIYDYGQQDNTFYFVMQFVEGESLTELVDRKGKLSHKDAVRMVTEIAKGLERAHDHGLIHRDIKPDNVLISKRKEVLITDFGLVKEDTAAVDSSLTAGGAILGTPAYMSPEQCQGLPDVDGRTDLYSLGLIFYRLVTGHVPVKGETAMQIMHNRILEDPPEPRSLNPAITLEVNQLLKDLLQREPDARIPTATALLERLESLPEPSESARLENSASQVFPSESSGSIDVYSGPADSQSAAAVLAGQVMPAGSEVTQAYPPNYAHSNPAATPEAGPNTAPGVAGVVSPGVAQAVPLANSSSAPIFVQNPSDPSASGVVVPGHPMNVASSNIVPGSMVPGSGVMSQSGIMSQSGVLIPGMSASGVMPGYQNPQDQGLSLTTLLVIVLVVFTLLTIVALALIFMKSNQSSGQVAIQSFTGVVEYTNKAALTIQGQANRGPVVVTIGAESSSSEEDGSFKRTLKLLEGENSFTLEIKGSDGRGDQRSFKVVRDSIAPALVFENERQGTAGVNRVVLKSDRVLKGRVKDKNPQSVALQQTGDWQALELSPDGQFSIKMPSSDRDIEVRVEAKDRAGNSTEKSILLVSRKGLDFQDLSEVPRWTRKEQLLITGSATYGPVKVSINGTEKMTEASGAFSAYVVLPEKENKIVLTLRGENKALAKREFLVKRDNVSPTLAFDNESSQDEIRVPEAGVLTGKVLEQNLAELLIDGQKTEVGEDGRFERRFGKLEGVRTVIVIAKDYAGNQVRRELRLVPKTKLTIELDQGVPAITRKEKWIFVGRASHKQQVTGTLNRQKFQSDASGQFKLTAPLIEGENVVSLSIRDKEGNADTRQFKIVRDTAPPTVRLTGELVKGEIYLEKDLLLKGQVREKHLESVKLGGISIEIGEDGKFEVPQTLEGDNKLVELVIRDRAGNQTVRHVRVFAPRPLTIKIEPEIPDWTQGQSINVQGVALPSPVKILVGRKEYLSDDKGRFQFTLPLQEGLNEVIVKFSGPRKLKSERKISIQRDSQEPIVSLDGESEQGQVALGDDWILRGQIDEANLVSAKLDDDDIQIDGDGRFEFQIKGREDPHNVTLVVTDKAKNELRRVISVGTLKKFQDLAVTESLTDIDAWISSPKEIQDRAIAQVASQLKRGYSFVETVEYKCRNQSFRIATFKHKKTGILLHLLPGGRFQMGSQDSDPSERPLHEVAIRPFLIGRVEVKQKEWDAVGGKDKRKRRGAALPMEGVSWTDIQIWLQKAGERLRLPSESEWEYACRAGTTTRYFWGSEWTGEYCWFRGNSNKNYDKVRRTHPASEHEKFFNAFGLIDMLGNVKEWCQDDYIKDYKRGPYDNRSRGKGTGTNRVVRGGSWNTDFSYCRTYGRFRHAPNFATADLGFRVARNIRWDGKRSYDAASKRRTRPKRLRVRKTTLAAILRDREQWQKASPAIQDAAVRDVSKRLGKAFKFLEARVYVAGGQRHRIASFVHVRTGMVMRLIPGGEYYIGDASGRSNEKPTRRVVITKPFLVGMGEVRQQEWDRIGGQDKRAFKGDALPIDSVSFEDVKAWLDKLGGELRLPSEAEWEYACRAGTRSKYFWGNNFDGTYLWYRSNSDKNYSKRSQSHPASEHGKKTNAFGLVDMLGNLKEWCQDDYFGDYSKGPVSEKPRGAGKTEYRVVRGGSWYSKKEDCRSAVRLKFTVRHLNKDLGFRVAANIP